LLATDDAIAHAAVVPVLAFSPIAIINYLAPLSVFLFAVVGVFTNNNLCTDTPLLVFSPQPST